MKNTTDYWFVIEPYVYINIADGSALLYNTLDGTIIESSQIEVITLLQDFFQEENAAVPSLNSKQLEESEIKIFVQELREKYMGDIIDVSLSKGKPVQILPYINYLNRRGKKCNFNSFDNLLQTLFEISIHIDYTINVDKLKLYLQSTPKNVMFNILGDWRSVKNGYDLIDFLNKQTNPKSILCLYTQTFVLEPEYSSGFSYKITITFPIDKQQLNNSIQLMRNQNFPFGYIFDVASLQDCQEAEKIVKEYHIEKHQLNPVYTGNNIDFFKENVFLTKEDILSTAMSMKDFFTKRSINKNDFGKIHIMSNGDIYANINHPILGNMNTHNLYTIIHKEIKYGYSWLRTRDEYPCSTCLYQYLCPSPSDYEIIIDRPNLCCVK